MTKISEDRLRELCSGSVMAAATPGEEIAMARELLTLRTSPPSSGEAGEPKVRPLEWLDGVAIGAARLRYSVRAPSLTPGWRAWVQVLDARGGSSTGGAIVTMAAADEGDAKALCQADYETRIRSALLPTIKEPTETPTPPPIGDGEGDLGRPTSPIAQPSDDSRNPA
jgi:hypothetical protein